MNSSIDLQQILIAHLDSYRQRHLIDPRSRQVLFHIGNCHTEVMGGVMLRCDM